MKESIESMRRSVLPQSREWFELMAEAPRDEIERLRREVAEYQARCESAA